MLDRLIIVSSSIQYIQSSKLTSYTDPSTGEVEAVAPTQGVLGRFADGLTDHIPGPSAPAPRAIERERPYALLARAIAVQEFFVENRVVALAMTGNIHLKTLGDFARAFLEYSPGLDGFTEEALKSNCGFWSA